MDITLKNIEIDNETADRIVVAVMREQHNYIKQEIEIQKKISNLKEHEKEDLEYNLRYLDAVVLVYKHYTAPSDWSEIED